MNSYNVLSDVRDNFIEYGGRFYGRLINEVGIDRSSGLTQLCILLVAAW